MKHFFIPLPHEVRNHYQERVNNNIGKLVSVILSLFTTAIILTCFNSAKSNEQVKEQEQVLGTLPLPQMSLPMPTRSNVVVAELDSNGQFVFDFPSGTTNKYLIDFTPRVGSRYLIVPTGGDGGLLRIVVYEKESNKSISLVPFGDKVPLGYVLPSTLSSEVAGQTGQIGPVRISLLPQGRHSSILITTNIPKR